MTGRKVFFCLVASILLAATTFAQTPESAASLPPVTYKTGMYYFSSGAIRITDPNDQLYINYVGNTWGVPDNIQLKNLVVNMWPGTLHGCTTPPQIQVSVDGGIHHTNYNLPNDQAQVLFTSPLTAVTAPQTITILFFGGQNCTITGGGALFIYPGWQELVAVGGHNSYFMTDTFLTNAPGAGTTNYLKQTFDNPLPSDPVYVQTAVDILAGQVNSLRPFENCAPQAFMNWSGGSFSVNENFENSAAGQELIPQVLQNTTAGSPVTHTINLGTGCTPELVGFNTTMLFGTDTTDAGPFYFPGYYDTQNINTGSYVVAAYVRGTTPLILKSFRVSTVGGMYPKNCTTYPSVALKSGTITAKSLTLANGTDPYWSGSLTIPTSPTNLLQFQITPGVGCDAGEVQFNLLAAYTTQ